MIKFVIIDDERWVRSVLKNAVPWSRLGFELAGEAADGERGLRLVERTDPGLVLTDIRMPGLDGFELIAAIGGRAAAARVVIVTGHDTFSYAQRAVRNGVFAFITKPIEERELADIARDVKADIEGSRRRAERLAKAEDRAARLREAVRWEAQRTALPGNSVAGTVEDPRIGKALDLVAAEYASPIGTREVSERLFMSEAYFCDRFHRVMGKTFSTYLAEYRVDAAATLLRRRELRVKDIAPLVGYGNANYFCRVFKRYTGLTPGEYRNRSE